MANNLFLIITFILLFEIYNYNILRNFAKKIHVDNMVNAFAYS